MKTNKKEEIQFEGKIQSDKNWELIEKIINNTPNCWVEVKRLDTDFGRIEIKGTTLGFETNLKGILEIIEDMFETDIKE